ncbi:MAG: SPOR domain-containing protein [Anaerobiospirillum succiniciproducens]|uniref:SPOR domain-containing protein n=1 Tax=Anaerobiospirillum succiniciproducens TaxID=13335 RepID=UPI002A748078|nr:SPOR domain-containing protein [Anaerobiospirillum succiniciproducens]MDY2799633.1 SPOR domain-containing protein [Anaerobiospirillum succiniciproducens]
MKFNLGEKGGLSNLPPQKKRVLAIGGIAFIVLLFVSFLLSLTEDDGSNQTQEVVSQEANQPLELGSSGELQLPSSQRYDFENNVATNGGGIEDLLNDAPQTDDGPIGVDKSPFENQPNTQSPSQGLGPLPMPTEEEEALGDQQAQEQAPEAPQAAPASTKAVLYCDSYTNAADAESQKAVLAFQGVTAQVVKNQDGTLGLKLGPFPSAERAREAFSFLADKGLLQQCGLIQE